MKRKKKKPANNTINWPQTIVSALADLISGLLILLIDRMLE